MKLTTKRLRHLIREELKQFLNEGAYNTQQAAMSIIDKMVEDTDNTLTDASRQVFWNYDDHIGTNSRAAKFHRTAEREVGYELIRRIEKLGGDPMGEPDDDAEIRTLQHIYQEKIPTTFQVY